MIQPRAAVSRWREWRFEGRVAGDSYYWTSRDAKGVLWSHLFYLAGHQALCYVIGWQQWGGPRK